MTEQHVECILQRARELYPEASPRIISDNGPQFIAGDFKQYIRLTGMTHVRTSPYYPQSKSSRPAANRALAQDPQSRRHPPEDTRHTRRGRSCRRHLRRALQPQSPHSVIDYVTPADRLAARHKAINEARDIKLEAARQQRAAWRQAARRPNPNAPSSTEPLASCT